MSRYAPMYEMSRPYVYESVWMANARREDCRRQRTVHGRGRKLPEGEEDTVIVLERGVAELPVIVVSTETWRATGPQGERDERKVEIDRGSGKEEVWTYSPIPVQRDEASQAVERVASRRGAWTVSSAKENRTKRIQECTEEQAGQDGKACMLLLTEEMRKLPAAVIGAAQEGGVLVCGKWTERKAEQTEAAAFTVQYLLTSTTRNVDVRVEAYLASREEIAARGQVSYEKELAETGEGYEVTILAHVYLLQQVPRGEWAWFLRHDIVARAEEVPRRKFPCQKGRERGSSPVKRNSPEKTEEGAKDVGEEEWREKVVVERVTVSGTSFSRR